MGPVSAQGTNYHGGIRGESGGRFGQKRCVLIRGGGSECDLYLPDASRSSVKQTGQLPQVRHGTYPPCILRSSPRHGTLCLMKTQTKGGVFMRHSRYGWILMAVLTVLWLSASVVDAHQGHGKVHHHSVIHHHREGKHHRHVKHHRHSKSRRGSGWLHHHVVVHHHRSGRHHRHMTHHRHH